ncbi:MAG: hypothetical protein CVV61_08890, partial [Tenericutes bacterium HGW-Tenericutes-6]
KDYNYASIYDLEDTNYTKFYYYDLRGNLIDVKKFFYGQNDYQYYTIPRLIQRNYGSSYALMIYNGVYDYQDIYCLDIDEIPSLYFTYRDAITEWQLFGMTTTLLDSNLNTAVEGYYYNSYQAIGGNYNVTFNIVFKVGNPINGATTPQEHIHYNYSTTWLDQLTSYGEISYVNGVPQTEVTEQLYSYDNQGNPIGITNFFFDDGDSQTNNYWNHAKLEYDGRQVTRIYIYSDSAENNLVDTIIYTYNDQGYRTSKTVGGVTTEYFLQGDKVLYETNGTYGIIYTYDVDGTLISFNYDNNINQSPVGIEYYYIRSQQGDVTRIIDKDGNIVVEYEYDAWGNITKTDGSLEGTIGKLNPYRYRGYRFDEEIQMYYLNSRYYDANIGRFINADGMLGSIGNTQSTNMYAYCANNPVMHVDPSGESFL